MRTHQFEPMKNPELTKQNRRGSLSILLHQFIWIIMDSEQNRFRNFCEWGYGKEIVATCIVMSSETRHFHEMQHASPHRTSLYVRDNSSSLADHLIHIPESPRVNPSTVPVLRECGRPSASINESTYMPKVYILLKNGHDSLLNTSIQVNENGVRRFHIKEYSNYIPKGVYTQ